MLKVPIIIPVLELTTEEVEDRERARELGLPMPDVTGEEVEMYFYNIDALMPAPDKNNKQNLVIIFSGGQEFVTTVKIEDIITTIKKAQSY